MKENIHPKYAEVKVACSCGHTFATKSTLGHDLHVEICAKCHPYYSGQQKLIDTEGRVDAFRNKFANFGSMMKKKA